MKAITYEEAGKILEVDAGTIRSAANRNPPSLTKVPVTGKTQMVIEEQVQLFAGKKQIRKSMLSKEELALWNQYEKNVNQPEASHPTPSDVDTLVAKLPKAKKAMDFLYDFASMLEKHQQGDSPQNFPVARMVPHR